jgi:hypothetical protein
MNKCPVNQEILIILKFLLTKDLHYQCGAELNMKLTVIMKCSMGNLPSSALTPIFEDVFLAPKVNLQKFKWILSQGVLSIKVKLSISLLLISALRLALICQITIHKRYFSVKSEHWLNQLIKQIIWNFDWNIP